MENYIEFLVRILPMVGLIYGISLLTLGLIYGISLLTLQGYNKRVLRIAAPENGNDIFCSAALRFWNYKILKFIKNLKFQKS